MSSAFVEGVQSIALPCSLMLIVPVLAVALAVGGRPIIATSTAVGGAVAAMWLRAAGLVPATLATAGPVGLSLLMLGIMVLWLRRGAAVGTGVAFLGLGPGLLAGWIWRPCVGTALGEVLGRAAERSPGSVIGLAVYALGVLLPVLALALARVAVGRDLQPRPLAISGAVLGGATAALVVSGLDDRVIGWLVRWSS